MDAGELLGPVLTTAILCPTRINIMGTMTTNLTFDRLETLSPFICGACADSVTQRIIMRKFIHAIR